MASSASAQVFSALPLEVAPDKNILYSFGIWSTSLATKRTLPQAMYKRAWPVPGQDSCTNILTLNCFFCTFLWNTFLIYSFLW